MWTSADTARDAYQMRLVKLIRDNAERIASGSDVTTVNGKDQYNKAHLILDELIQKAEK